MSHYLIHTIPRRQWYVDNFLIPSMLEQGISRYSIDTYCDKSHEGNLRAFISSTHNLSDEWGTWHLQDDIIISPDFREKTEQYNEGIVSGFCSTLYDTEEPGEVPAGKLWKGFQCIRIPNYLIKECITWYYQDLMGNPAYDDYWSTGNNDDWIFRQYIKISKVDEPIINLAPNIVNHIDYLIGGSEICQREQRLISKYWEHDYLIDELKEKLDKFTTNNDTLYN